MGSGNSSNNTVTFYNLYNNGINLFSINGVTPDEGDGNTNNLNGSDNLSYTTLNAKLDTNSIFQNDYTGITDGSGHTIALFSGQRINNAIEDYTIANIEIVGDGSNFTNDNSINDGSAKLFVLVLGNNGISSNDVLASLGSSGDTKHAAIESIQSQGNNIYPILIPLTTVNNVIIYNMFDSGIDLIINDSYDFTIDFNYDYFSSLVDSDYYPTFYFDLEGLSVEVVSGKKATPTSLEAGKKYVLVVFSGQKRGDDGKFNPVVTTLNSGSNIDKLLLAIFEESGSTEAEYRTFFKALLAERSTILTETLKAVVPFA